MSVYPMTTPLDLRLHREIFKFGPLKWGHHHWTVGVVSPTRRRPGIRQHKSSVPHPHPQEKGCGRSANEPYVKYRKCMATPPRFVYLPAPSSDLENQSRSKCTSKQFQKVQKRLVAPRLEEHLRPREPDAPSGRGRRQPPPRPTGVERFKSERFDSKEKNIRQCAHKQ
ncbi:hypothetical protein EVAR_48605_1 [Eumeta japonica]|uniref:Uncharacterized protein n=1 Tax=Eumeta variegata TaxID=151549 RepID=A0A4C1XWA3_EUMVA|nr:hypothetical protein EVAR_48605_1 [Eumeta japonica]